MARWDRRALGRYWAGDGFGGVHGSDVVSMVGMLLVLLWFGKVLGALCVSDPTQNLSNELRGVKKAAAAALLPSKCW